MEVRPPHFSISPIFIRLAQVVPLPGGQNPHYYVEKNMKNTSKSSGQTSGSSLGAQLSIASELGGAIVISVLLGFFAGNWIDGALKCAPLGIFAGLIVGMGLGMTIVVKRCDQLDKKTRADKPEPPAQSK